MKNMKKIRDHLYEANVYMSKTGNAPGGRMRAKPVGPERLKLELLGVGGLADTTALTSDMPTPAAAIARKYVYITPSWARLFTTY